MTAFLLNKLLIIDKCKRDYDEIRVIIFVLIRKSFYFQYQNFNDN